MQKAGKKWTCPSAFFCFLDLFSMVFCILCVFCLLVFFVFLLFSKAKRKTKVTAQANTNGEKQKKMRKRKTKKQQIEKAKNANGPVHLLRTILNEQHWSSTQVSWSNTRESNAMLSPKLKQLKQATEASNRS